MPGASRPQDPAAFALVIDFERHSPDPGRVFRAADNLIRSFDQIDRALVGAIDPHLEPILVLEDLETGSLRIWLKQVLESVDDQAIKDLNWRKAVGAYLVRGKYVLINFLNRSSTVTDRSEIEAVSRELQRLAGETQVLHLPAYQPVPPTVVAKQVAQLSQATEALRPNDRAVYVTKDGAVPFDLTVKVSPERFEELLTQEELTTTRPMILRIKKPDYLGASKWEFHHDGRTIEARIGDVEWLRRFQARQVEVRPGDALRADVTQVTRYGYDYDVVSTTYIVERVRHVIAGAEQPPLIRTVDPDNDSSGPRDRL